jgi:hypothetical protein
MNVHKQIRRRAPGLECRCMYWYAASPLSSLDTTMHKRRSAHGMPCRVPKQLVHIAYQSSLSALNVTRPRKLWSCTHAGNLAWSAMRPTAQQGSDSCLPKSPSKQAQNVTKPRKLWSCTHAGHLAWSAIRPTAQQGSGSCSPKSPSKQATTSFSSSQLYRCVIQGLHFGTVKAGDKTWNLRRVGRSQGGSCKITNSRLLLKACSSDPGCYFGTIKAVDKTMSRVYQEGRVDHRETAVETQAQVVIDWNIFQWSYLVFETGCGCFFSKCL